MFFRGVLLVLDLSRAGLPSLLVQIFQLLYLGLQVEGANWTVRSALLGFLFILVYVDIF
jgi:hypothetical protein